MNRSEELRAELSAWCESTLNTFLAEVDLEASPEVVEQLTQVVEAHAAALAGLREPQP